MPAITIIHHPNMRFSAFSVVQDIINKAERMDTMGNHIEIRLEGFDEHQTEAVHYLLLNTFLRSVYENFPTLTAQRTTHDGRVTFECKVPELGTVTSSHDKTNKTETLSLPVGKNPSLPTADMQKNYDEFKDTIGSPSYRNKGVDLPQADGPLIPIHLSDLALLHTLYPIVASLAEAHGHNSKKLAAYNAREPISTCEFPAILVPIKTYSTLCKNEGLGAYQKQR